MANPHNLLFRPILLLWLSTALIGVGTPASAQETPPPAYNFVFTNPGARSMGFGGAFVALADDATAAFANPAGLVQLLEREISVELRYIDEEEDSGLKNESGLGFVSFVYPSERWSASFSSHQMASGGFLEEGFSITSHTLSGALQVSEHLSMGIGVSYYNGGSWDGTFGDSDDDNGDLQGNDVGFQAGLLWSPSPSWKIGTSYRQGAELTSEASDQGLAIPVISPDVLAFGTSWRSPDGKITVALEYDQIDYASLREAAGSSSSYRDIHDGSQIRLGAEFVKIDWNPVTAFRAGVWSDRDRAGFAMPATDDEEVHTAIGLGLAWNSFQIDLGLDSSHSATTFSVSAIFTL